MYYLPVSAERKALFARRDLVDKLQIISTSKRMSLYNLVNEIFEDYVKLVESNTDFEEIINEILFYKRMNKIGFILVPSSIWFKHLKESPRLEEWRELGEWLGKYYNTLNAENPLELLLRDLEKALNWIGELSIERKGKRLEVALSLPHSDYNSIVEPVLTLLRGALSVFNYKETTRIETTSVVSAVYEEK